MTVPTMPADAAEIVRLAGRVEQATGPDRELDYEIHERLHGEWLRRNAYIREPGDDGWYSATPPVKGTHSIAAPQSYTASLDAAMTLVDGVGVLLGLSDIGADGLPLARVGIPHLPDAPVFTGIASCIMTKTAPVAGLALAVTAAALKARARAAQHDHEVG